MISIRQAIEEIIQSKPFLEEDLRLGIINLTSLSRLLLPEVQEKTFKEVTPGAIVMALTRLVSGLPQRTMSGKAQNALGDITIRSNLIDFAYHNSISFMEHYQQLLLSIPTDSQTFLNVSQSVDEVTVVANSDLGKAIRDGFKDETLIKELNHLSSLTIKFKNETAFTPGIYYILTKLLAWENISIVEVISTHSELTLVLKKEDIDRAFSLIKRLT